MSKIALVTGNSSQLAQQLISLLKNKNYIVISSSSQELDLNSDKSCELFIKKIIAKYQALDLVINVAGVSISGPGLNYSSSDLTKLININCIATFRLLKYTTPYLTKSSPGKFIAISSLCSLVPFPNYSLYTASKFALRGLCLSMYHELLLKNIHLTCVNPGAISRPDVKISPHSARGKIPFLNWLMPLTSYELVSKTILKTILSSKPIPEISIGRDAVLLSMAYKYLPSPIWNLAQQFVWRKQQ